MFEACWYLNKNKLFVRLLQERMSDMHKELWQLHPKIEDADKRHEVVQAAARIRHRSPLFEEEKGHEEPYVPVKPYIVKLCSISIIETLCCLNAEGFLTEGEGTNGHVRKITSERFP
jgi:hypothetical protein